MQEDGRQAQSLGKGNDKRHEGEANAALHPHLQNFILCVISTLRVSVNLSPGLIKFRL